MEKKVKSIKSATPPPTRLESEGLKRGDEGKEREGEKMFLDQTKPLWGLQGCGRSPTLLKEKGIEIGRRGSFNKLFLPKKKYAKRFDQTFLKFDGR